MPHVRSIWFDVVSHEGYLGPVWLQKACNISPYRILHQINPVPYKLDLPRHCHLNPSFHMSQLNLVILGPLVSDSLSTSSLCVSVTHSRDSDRLQLPWALIASKHGQHILKLPHSHILSFLMLLIMHYPWLCMFHSENRSKSDLLWKSVMVSFRRRHFWAGGNHKESSLEESASLCLSGNGTLMANL